MDKMKRSMGRNSLGISICMSGGWVMADLEEVLFVEQHTTVPCDY